MQCVKPRNYPGFFLGVAVAVLLAVLLSRVYYPAVSWFLGGALIGLSVQIFCAPREKRRLSRVILAMTGSGAAAALVVYLVGLVGLS